MIMLRAGGLLDVLTPLSDCRQESVEKVERRISGVSYMYWMDFYNGILCCGFLCAPLISVSLFRLPRRGLPRPTYTPRAITPRAITPLPPLHGYHACIYISRLSRHSLVLLLGYHTRAITLHHKRKSGYHTRHSSQFVVYRSPAITPGVFLLSLIHISEPTRPY